MPSDGPFYPVPRTTLLTPDAAQIEQAQRSALAGTLKGNALRELSQRKLDPDSIRQRLRNVRRRHANRIRAMEQAAKAAERLPALEKQLADAKADLTVPAEDVAVIEKAARACARKAAHVADAATMEAARIEVSTIDAMLESIDAGDGEALIEGTRYLAQYEKPSR